MKYFSDVEKQHKELEDIREFLQLGEYIKIDESEIIEEGFFGRLFSKWFKRGGEICGAISKGLEADQGKKWRTFVDNFFKEYNGEKSIKNDNAEETIKGIEKTRAEMVEKGGMDEKQSYGYAVNMAFVAAQEHTDDKEYKDAITKKIAEWNKLGGDEAKKIVDAARNAAKKFGNNGSENGVENQTVSPEQGKQNEKAASTLSNQLKGDNKTVTNIVKRFWPTQESLLNTNEIIFEGNQTLPEWVSKNDTVKNFRKKYLMPGKKDDKRYEEREKARNSFIAFISAISSFLEHVNCDGKEKWNFINALLSDENFQKEFGY